MNFESLVGRINLIQDALQAQAAHAVNLSLTARNWLVGYHIVEFEQHGETTVQYATEGLSQNLFVSKYRLQLPSEDDIRKYMLENITEEDFMEMKGGSC